MSSNDEATDLQAPSKVLAIVNAVDKVGEFTGKLFSWLVIPIALFIGYEVVSRHVFDRPTMWVYDVTWMLYGAHFMLGTAYTLHKKGHIRTDLLYIKWSPKTQAWVDIIGYLVFFFPGMTLFFVATLDRTILAWSLQEVSAATPLRPPIYPAITAMPVSIGLLMLQGVCEVTKCIYFVMRGGKHAS